MSVWVTGFSRRLKKACSSFDRAGPERSQRGRPVVFSTHYKQRKPLPCGLLRTHAMNVSGSISTRIRTRSKEFMLST